MSSFSSLVGPADGAGGAITDDSGIDYGVLVGERGGGGSNPGRRRGGNGPTCTYRLMGGPENFPVFDVDGTVVQVETGGAWYEKTCDGVFVGAVYLRGAPNAVDPAEVAAGVLRRMTVPVPKVALSPAGEQVVNLPSWLWIAVWRTPANTAFRAAQSSLFSSQSTRRSLLRIRRRAMRGDPG